ncbi:F0F1 ATP synthase subunit delta [Streptococcus dentapri]|uniref:ATP synthase subunit delta n=1 Tax=Streptococcus dentapri TaxID=573564 RepID=A0ABV8CYY3_9STRE
MDRKLQAVIEQYADSLAQVVLEKGLVSEIQDEISICLSVFEENSLSTYLSSLAIARDDKVKVVRLFQASSSDYLKNFFEIILQNERESLIEPIFKAVQHKLIQATREFPLTVTSAVALSDQQKERVLDLANRKFEIRAQDIVEDIDQSIIGGFIIEANNQIIDASIRSQLQQLKNNFK